MRQSGFEQLVFVPMQTVDGRDRVTRQESVLQLDRYQTLSE